MGGNVFENTEPIRKEDIAPTLHQFKLKLKEIFPKIDFDFKLLGSTGKKDISNDIDIALGENVFFSENNKLKWADWGVDKHQLCLVYIQIRKRARTATIKQSKLRALIKVISYKLLHEGILADNKNSGSGSLFCCFPQYNEKGEQLDKTVQIDINFGNVDWLNFSYYSEVYEGNIKGLHRTQLLVALFAYKNRIFKHGTGIFNKETGECEAKTPDEAISLLYKLYDINVEDFIKGSLPDKDFFNNYYHIINFIKTFKFKEQKKIYDIYLKILDSTRADIPEGFLQDYWKENQKRLVLEGSFLPENSKLYEWLRGRK